MRVDPNRIAPLAFWFAAMLVIAGMPPEDASAQAARRQGAPSQGPPGSSGSSDSSGYPGSSGSSDSSGYPGSSDSSGYPGSSGSSGYPGSSGSSGPQGYPGASGPGQQQAAPAGPREPAVDHEAIPSDTSSLARYIPAGTMGLYFEFPGLNAAPDAWQGSSASEMLKETSLGDMLREVIAQYVEVAPDAPAGVMTGPEVVAVFEHVARQGLILASAIDEERGSDGMIVVLRGAAHAEIRPIFGKLIGTIAAEGASPQVESKPGNRQVVAMDGGPMGLEQVDGWSWWIEGNDLVFIIGEPEATDRVIAVLDGQEPSIEDDPVRQELMADEAGFRPVAFGTYRFDRPGASATDRAMLDESGLTRADLRWGFEGAQSLTVVQLQAPSPRGGIMAVFDQPAIPMGELPPIHREVDSLTVLSLDLAGAYDALRTIAQQGMPPLAEALDSLEESVRTRGRMDLKDDVLAALGPKVAAYTLPRPAPRQESNRNNPLGAVMGALGAFSLPQVVVAIEVEDASAFTSKLDGLILALNQQIARLLPPPPEEPAEPAAGAGAPPGAPPGQPPARGGRQGGGSGQAANRRAPAPPEAPKFSMTLAEPRTYLLRLPEGLAALTGYQPTLTMGKSHLIFATNPAAARQCRELEQARPEDRWTPPAELASRAPGNVMMMSVSDSTQSLPMAIASLPAVLNASLAPPAPPAVAGAGAAAGAGGGVGGSGPAGYPGASSGYPGSSGGGSGSPDQYSGGSGRADEMEISSGGSSSGMSPPPGAPGGAPGAQAGPGSIRLDPSLVPSPDALRRYLGMASYIISTDDSGIRIEARESLPMQWSFEGFGGMPGLSVPLPGLPGGGN